MYLPPPLSSPWYRQSNSPIIETRSAAPLALSPIHQSIESDGETVVARGDLRRRVGIGGANECLLQRRRLASQLRIYIVGRSGIRCLRRPEVARRRVQHVRRVRRALARAPTWAALRAGVEERAGGYVGVLVDVLGEALAGAVRRG